MNENEKYSMILRLSSVGNRTVGTYPTFRDFKDALDTDRVFGDYDKRTIIISSNNRHVEYLFAGEDE